MDADAWKDHLVFLLAAGAVLVLVFLFVAYSTVGT